MWKIKYWISIKQAINRLRGILDTTKLQPIANKSAIRLSHVFAQLTPVSKAPDVDPRRGNLRAGWRGVGIVNNIRKQLQIHIYNVDPRARRVWPILLFGSRPHKIKAKRAKFLVFLQRNRTMFIGPQVKHPGTRPKIEQRVLQNRVHQEISRLKQTIQATLLSGKP